jgi:hypothetical protein
MNRAVSDLVSIPRGRRSAGRARRQIGRAPEAKRPPRPGPLALLRLRAPADPRHPLPGCAPRPRLGVDAALLADLGGLDSGCRETHFGQPCCQVHRPVVRYSFDRQNSRHAVFGSSPVSTYVKSPFDSRLKISHGPVRPQMEISDNAMPSNRFGPRLRRQRNTYVSSCPRMK